MTGREPLSLGAVSAFASYLPVVLAQAGTLFSEGVTGGLLVPALLFLLRSLCRSHRPMRRLPGSTLLRVISAGT